MAVFRLFLKQINFIFKTRLQFTCILRNSGYLSPLPRFNVNTLNNSLVCWNKYHPRKCILYSGILAWLGFKDKDDSEKEDPLITTIKRGIISMQNEDYNIAEQMFHLALKIAQERADQQAQTYIYDMMANNAFHKRNFPTAEKLFLEVTRRLIANGKPTDDNSIVEISLKLAYIYSQQKQNEKAVEGFKFCISTQEAKINKLNVSNVESLSENDKDTILLWAMATDWYGRHLMEQGHFRIAQECFLKALETSEKINGPYHPQTLVLMNDIGSIASLRKDFKTAVHYFKQAIEKGTEIGTPDLPSFYCNLGATYIRTGNFSEASVACKKALHLAKSVKNGQAEADAKGCLEELQELKKAAA